jgi:hypothetical protein
MDKVKVQIELDEHGFEHMWDNSMAWNGYSEDWQVQDGRFSPKPDWTFTWAYFYDNYINAMLGMSYLKAIDELATMHSDEAGGWLIVTNYASPCHQ